jgi:uncharacterized protein (TIGR02099 family)
MALNPPPGILPHTASTWARALRWSAWALGSAAAVLLIAWLALVWGILPHVQQWREPIAQRLSQALGVPVRIGHIEVRAGGWSPEVELRQVELLDAQGRVGLRLARIQATFSPRSMLLLEPSFQRLRLDDPDLEVRRDPQGRVFVGGLQVLPQAAAASDETPALDWLLSQPHWAIRNGTLRWVDETRSGQPLELRAVHLQSDNGLLQHELRLDATPPPGWGQPFTVQARFHHALLARRSDWTRWSGQLRADLPQVDVQQLRDHVQLPFDLIEGRGALSLTVQGQEGHLRQTTMELALDDVRLRLSPRLEPLVVKRLQAQVQGERDPEQVALAVRRLRLQTTDGLEWPESELHLRLQQREGEGFGFEQPVTSGEFSASRLDLAPLAGIAERLPLGQALRDLLAQLQPQGQAQQLRAHWEGPLDAPLRYGVQGRLSSLSLAPGRPVAPDALARPGVQGAEIELDAHEAGGQAVLSLPAGGAVELPGLLEAARIPLGSLRGNLQWRIQPAALAGSPPQVEVRTRDLRLANADARLRLNGVWRTGPGQGAGRAGRFPGVLDLRADLEQAQATRVARYLPLKLPASVRTYVERAVRGGIIDHARFVVQGPLWDFPFSQAQGEGREGREGRFHMLAKVRELQFDYLPPDPHPGAGTPTSIWPGLTQLSGELELDHHSLQARATQGRLLGWQLGPLQAGIANLADHPVLELRGQAQGPLADALSFVHTTPIGGWLHGHLAQAEADGPAALDLSLRVPLRTPGQSSVQGRLQLQGNSLRLLPGTPWLGQTSGLLEFSEQGFRVPQAQAQMMGGPLQFSGGLHDDGRVRFEGQGRATAQGLRQAAELGWLARAAAAFDGESAYRAALALGGAGLDLDITSSLQGLASRLPAPLNKPAEAIWPLRYAVHPAPAAASPGADPPHELLEVDLGTQLRARYRRQPQADGSMQVLEGQLRLGAALLTAEAAAPSLSPASPAAGELQAWLAALERDPPAAGPTPLQAGRVRAEAELPTLDVDVWLQTLRRLELMPVAELALPVASTQSAQAGQKAQSVQAAPATAAPPLLPGGGYLPTQLQLRTGSLMWGGRRLSQLVAQVSGEATARGRPSWQAEVQADQLAGRLYWQDGGRDDAAPTLQARLTRLALPPSEVEQVEDLLDEASRRMPVLDVEVERFELRGRPLGRLELQAQTRPRTPGPSADGVLADPVAGQEWRLSRLALLRPQAQFVASGRWRPQGPRVLARSALDFRLDVHDGGELLAQLGMPDVLRGAQGALHGELSWAGSPLSFDLASLGGRIEVGMQAGQFLKAEPGVARLLGVLNLQSLPRRLTLDFRDLFAEGFAFDQVSGHVAIAKGVAHTNNLRLRGVQAAVLMEGQADLQRETQDLRVVVVPEINAGTASLAYAVINPAVGLGTFLAQLFLRRPFMQAATREFQVGGSWSDPKVERRQRAADAPLPDLESPPSAEAASSPDAATPPSSAAVPTAMPSRTP